MNANIISVGARCPLGLSSAQVALCLRAQKGEPRALQILDKRGHEVSLAFTGGLGATLHGFYRMVRLGAPALVEAFEGAKDKLPALGDDGVTVPLVLAVSEQGRPDDDDRIEGGQLIEELAAESGVPLDLERSTVVRKAQPGFAYALKTAAELLREGHPAVIVGGVDSYFHPGVLAWLDADCRLHSPTSENGFIPAEGAGFVVLANTKDALARVVAVEVGDEVTVGTEEPNVAATLTGLVAAVVAKTGEAEWVLNDTNGERHRQLEFDMVRVRQLPYEAPRDQWVRQTGDLGAATGALFTVVIAEWFKLGCAPADSALITFASEGPERAVLGLARADGGSRSDA